jgi:outer membrane protein OmpA-like peptidoglycan-associated protein
MENIRRSTFIGGVAVLLAAACVGCETAPPPEVRVVAVTAVTAEQAQPVLGAAGLAAIRSAAESDRGSFTLVVAGAPDLTRTLDLVARRETGSGSTQIEHGPRRGPIIDGLVAQAAAAVSGVAPTTGPPAFLGALAAAARGTPGTMLVLDSGVTTADPVDLRLLGWDGDPAAIIEHLRSANALPDLQGWDVQLIGLGRTDGAQAAPGTAQQRWLERFWSAVCVAGGARSCVVVPVLDPPRTPPPGTRSTALVPVPVSATVRLASGAVQTTLPDSRLGFAPGTADLPSDADQVLEPVAAAYRATPGPVRVEGFVAFWGDDAYRARLSQARAAAVAAVLVRLGVAPGDITAVGRGAADRPDASTTAGVFDEAKVVAHGIRRVVVTVDPRR